MKHKNVVVTGGRGALGTGVVAALEARGATVIVAPDPPELDLTSEDATTKFYAALPPLWASIHLVGGFAMKPLVDTSYADFEKQWKLNTATCFLSCREAVRAIRKTGNGGRIVNVAARPVVAPVAGMAAYVAAKAGVASLTQTLALELAAEHILVNAVLPSLIDTPANRAAMPDADHTSWPRPEEIARAIVFLVSPENTLTSGALLPVFGRA
ncbi:MAG: SDR family oxidoreductase [Myxococcota bacterium]|nr:SDR family oxidoreductase [Deltaproteobacteria bacterium]MDQ3337214.1 SDR family oxidoreductase [Myxococcota bacterium]